MSEAVTPWHDDGQAAFYLGDVREVLRELPAESVHCVVTSPPYWSLRDYGVPPTVWDEPEWTPRICPPGTEHEWGSVVEQKRGGAYTGTTRWQHIAGEADEQGVPVRTLAPEAWGLVDGHPGIASGQFCARCGAWRGALGLEPTPELFVSHTVEVFREVRRVLRPDGTLWLNIGDSYAAQGGPGAGGNAERMGRAYQQRNVRPHDCEGYKPKDLVGVPWMLAFALRADGWYLRQDIIWAKPNPMPESVTDRCTKAHEYLFLLTKSPRYYYDGTAIAEPLTSNPKSWGRHTVKDPGMAAPRARPMFGAERDGRDGTDWGDGWTRNKRSVWTIATAPFPEAHFATFPAALVKPCILAGTSERGCCSECGAPWERVVEREGIERNVVGKAAAKVAVGLRTQFSGAKPGTPSSPTTTGWHPTCAHEAGTVPCVVLDPFLGSGTTAMVAKSLGRRAIGIDLNPEYLEMALRRCAQQGLELAGGVP